MEYIFEFISELVLEGGIEASKCSKIPNYIRYPLIGILSFIFVAVIGFVIVTGFLLLKQNLIAGIMLISIGLFMFIMSVKKFREIYLVKKDTNDDE